MARSLGLGLIVLIAVMALVVAVQPSEVHVERSRTIAASPATVFGIVSDFGRFGAWSPWSRMDPDMKVEITGEPGTVGSTYRWTGDDQVGRGEMVITEVKRPEKVVMDLHFIEPFEAQSVTAYELEPTDDGSSTRMTWTMDTENGFVAKAMGLLVDMDAMIGADFEKGLDALAEVAEAEARAANEAGAPEGEGPADVERSGPEGESPDPAGPGDGDGDGDGDPS